VIPPSHAVLEDDGSRCSAVRVVVGVSCIVVGLVVLVGLRFIGPPGTRGHAAWTTHDKTRAALAGVVAIVAGVLLLTGGAD
jgi:uncharacterized membrane protein HdeD (DUF308 family)